MNKKTNSKSKTALLWDLFGAFIKQFASLFISILLARLLGPEEFGIIAMALVVINLSSVLTDVGFSNALVQQKRVNDTALSSVFYLNLGISFVLSCIIVGIAGFVADFFEEPKLQFIMYCLAIIPPVSAAGSIQSVILTKTLNFKRLTLRDIYSTVLAGLIAVAAAFSDFGVYSLVLQQILMVSLGTVFLWYATTWKPKWVFSTLEIKKLFRFSSYVFLDNIIRRIFLNIDTVFIAKVFSPMTLGYYNRAQSLTSQVDSYTTNSLSKVIFPVLSNIQDNDKGFKSTYHRAFNTISGIMVILIAPLYFLADILILNLLGEQWYRSVFLFEILILSTLISPHIGIMGKALLAKGFSKYRFKIGLIQRLLMLLPIGLGYFYGINVFAFAVVMVRYLIFLVFLMALERKMDIKFWTQLQSLLVPNLLFIGMLSIDYFLGINLNRWLIVGVFLCIHMIILKIVKHESYSFIYNTLLGLKRSFFGG